MANHDTVGKRLKWVLECADVSPAEAERVAGLPKSVIYRLLNDGRQKPNVTYLQKIANAMSISSAWLITGEGEPPTQFSIAQAPPSEPPIQAGTYEGRAAVTQSKWYADEPIALREVFESFAAAGIARGLDGLAWLEIYKSFSRKYQAWKDAGAPDTFADWIMTA
jgi:transcriptional regulator with XRE-family HTH domain